MRVLVVGVVFGLVATACSSNVATSEASPSTSQPPASTTAEPAAASSDVLSPVGATTTWRGKIGDARVTIEVSQQDDFVIGSVTYQPSGVPIRLLGRRSGAGSYVLREVGPYGDIDGEISLAEVADGVVGSARRGDEPITLAFEGVEATPNRFDPTIREGVYRSSSEHEQLLIVHFVAADSLSVSFEGLALSNVSRTENRVVYAHDPGCNIEIVIFDRFAFVTHLDGNSDCGSVPDVAGPYVLIEAADDELRDPADSFVTAGQGADEPPAGTMCRTSIGLELDYWVWDGSADRCVRGGTHQALELANKDFATVTIQFPWGETRLTPDDFRYPGNAGELLGVGWHEFDSSPFDVPGIWIVDPADSIFAEAQPTAEGFGPLRVGQTWSELADQYGVQEYRPELGLSDFCRVITIPDDPYSPFLVMVGHGDDSVLTKIVPIDNADEVNVEKVCDGSPP